MKKENDFTAPPTAKQKQAKSSAKRKRKKKSENPKQTAEISATSVPKLIAQQLLAPTQAELKGPVKPKEVKQEDSEDLGEELKSDTSNVAWKPLVNPETGRSPQSEFLSATEDIVLMSGTRGSAKSDALLVDPLRYCDNRYFRALVIRKAMPDLRDLIERCKVLYPDVYPGVRWKEQEKIFVFPSGARIEFGYCENKNDVERYRGQEYAWLGIDELTMFADEDTFDSLCSSVRVTKPGLPAHIRCCVDEGEVLTVSGWKAIQDVEIGEKVYSVTPSGETVEAEVYDNVAFDVDEDLARVRMKNLYMSITQDHRIVHHKNNSDNTYTLSRFNEVFTANNRVKLCRAPLSYDNVGYSGYTYGMSVDTYLAFMGLYLAEGCVVNKVHKGCYTVIITQAKETTVTKVKALLEDTGLHWIPCTNGDFRLYKKDLWEYLKQFGKAKNKFVPREILSTANTQQLKILFDWLMLGDGSWQGDTSGTYVTTSPQLADDVAEIAVKLGYKVKITPVFSDNSAHNTRYNVFISTTLPVTYLEKDITDVRYERYKGKVYCLSVKDTENFILRQKGTVWLSGNTTNPYGVGVRWVKKRFIDKGPEATTITVNIETDIGTLKRTYRWIHSSWKDNPLIRKEYIAYLASIPDASKRKAFYEGSWDGGAGTAFPDFDRRIHVIKPFEIPHHWPRFRACDYGYTTMAACLWFAIDPEDRLYVYRELITTLVNAPDFADRVLDLERGENIKYGVIDGSLGANRGSSEPTLDEQMNRRGCRWRWADRQKGSRVANKNIIHQLLQRDKDLATEEYPDGQPRLVIFENCIELIEELSSLPSDEKNPEDVDTDAVDHAYDALRYGVGSRPRWHVGVRTEYQGPTIINSSFGY